ncbi:MAG TPA: hypothetical protein P5060_01060, partial [Candidatus Absconditabacterales bacterium]|nr:hypothetical protein [Candidatus Absconditabacterales bacterium]
EVEEVKPEVEEVKPEVEEVKPEVEETIKGSEEKLEDTKKINELHLESVGGQDVVENNNGDVVSDTGDNVESDVYAPNEKEFEASKNLLESSPKGPVSLSDLENNTDEKDAKQENNIEQNVSDNTEQGGMMDLDSMIEKSKKQDIAQDNDPQKKIDNLGVDKMSAVVVDNEESPQVENDKPGDIEFGNVEAEKVDQTVEQSSNQNTSNEQEVEENPKGNNHNGLKLFVLIILVLVGGFLLIKTMFPEEMRSMFGDDNQQEIISLDTGNLVQDTGSLQELDEDSLASQLQDTGNNIIEYVDTGSELDNNIDTGSNMSGFDTFGELDNAIDAVDSQYAEILERLRNYKSQGEDFNQWGRSQGNSTAMKYGLYISEKSQSVIDDIENDIEIDNTKVENYFAQFDIYLGKLEGLRESIEGPSVQSGSLISSGLNEQNPVGQTGTSQ